MSRRIGEDFDEFVKFLSKYSLLICFHHFVLQDNVLEQ